jgi:hypothetical protein
MVRNLQGTGLSCLENDPCIFEQMTKTTKLVLLPCLDGTDVCTEILIQLSDTLQFLASVAGLPDHHLHIDTEDRETRFPSEQDVWTCSGIEG